MLKMAWFKPMTFNMCQKKNRKLALGCKRAISLHKRNFSLFMYALWEPQWFWVSTRFTGSFTEESMLSLNSIKLRRTPHGLGKSIQLAGENRLKRLWFAAFSTMFSWTLLPWPLLLGCTTGKFHGTLELRILQTPGSLPVTSFSWLSVKILVSTWPTECYTARINISHSTS